MHVNTQKRHHGHGMGSFACVVGANCNSPPLQITHVTNHPCYKLPPLQIAHVFNCPHVEGRIAIRPYTGVIRTLANIHEYNVNIRKKHHGHGVSMFAYVVGTNCNSPMSQFAHIANYPCYNSPHVEGLIAISPYTCVIRTFANIHVNTQKSITGMV